MTTLKLTPHQEKAVDNIITFLCSPDQEYFILDGTGGTGKTFIIKYIYDNWKSIKGVVNGLQTTNELNNILIAALTNKASDVLISFGLPSKTLHATLGIIPKKNLTPLSFTKSLLIVDEASMVDSKMMDILKEANHKNNKVLFVGDHTQLPPVNDVSIVYNLDFSQTNLTEMVRQKYPPLQEMCNNAKQSVIEDNFAPIYCDDVHIFHYERNAFLKELDKEFQRPDWNSTESRYLTYTNNDAINIGARIDNLRRGLSNNNLVILPNTELVNNSFKLKGRIKTDEIVLVQEVNGTRVRVKNMWYELLPKNTEITVEDNFIDLRPIYASTVHKSQGSTFKKTFININNLKIAYNQSPNMFYRLLYVAVSRASEQVIFTGEL